MTATARLARLQEAFAAAVTGAGDAAIAGDLEGGFQAGLAVYRDSIAAVRERALRSAFPVVARLVGDAYFAEAARRHALASPPASADLNRYGEAFAAFLAGYEHASDLPWLADVARLEWAVHESLRAADAPALDFAALARVPEVERAGLTLALHPGVRLVRCAWPVLAIWEANQEGRDGTPDRDEGADDVLVWREGGTVRLERIEPGQAALLEGIARGDSLGEAVERAGDADPGRLLRELAVRGLLVGFRA
jgi:hypothetical protein